MSVCTHCQAEYDRDDAFCRKCGTALAQEAHYAEIEPALPTAIATEPTVIEVTALTTTEPAQPLATTGLNRVRSLTNRVGSTVSRALQSETGKKAVRGATALAVAVGMELLAQAANKPSQPASRKKMSPPVKMADSLLQTMEEELAPPQGQVIEEVYVRERIYMRRTIRRAR